MQERFVVRTQTCTPEGKFESHTTIAEGRPMAVKQAERIGKFDSEDLPKVREFLEHGPWNRSRSVCICSGGYSGWDGVATIYPLDE